ncbi:MAG: hypothetical protein PARBA_02439 [Parabacteroides sp.]
MGAEKQTPGVLNFRSFVLSGEDLYLFYFGDFYNIAFREPLIVYR